jgi:hypothetical protein
VIGKPPFPHIHVDPPSVVYGRMLSLTVPRNRTPSYVLALLAVTALTAISWFSLSYVNQRPMAFNRTRWLQARDQEDWQVRSVMASDLINRNALIG